MKEHDHSYLRHIEQFTSRIAEFTKNGRDEFFASPLIQDAVVRNIELIGEAVKNLSEEAKQAHPEIPWRSIARMRDKVIHHYFALNLDLVWEVVEKHVPPLRTTITIMLKEATASDSGTSTPEPERPPELDPR